MKCISHLSIKFVRLTIPAPKECVRELDITPGIFPLAIEVYRTSAITTSPGTEAPPLKTEPLTLLPGQRFFYLTLLPES